MEKIQEKDVTNVKLRLKTWEVEFERIHGAKPTKDDVKEAPQQVRDDYKDYWKWKTQRKEGGGGRIWGSHLDKDNGEWKKTKKENDEDLIGIFSKKIMTSNATNEIVKEEEIDSKENNDRDEELSERKGLRIVSKTERGRMRKARKIGRFDLPSFSRRLSVDSDWLNRCDETKKMWKDCVSASGRTREMTNTISSAFDKEIDESCEVGEVEDASKLLRVNEDEFDAEELTQKRDEEIKKNEVTLKESGEDDQIELIDTVKKRKVDNLKIVQTKRLKITKIDKEEKLNKLEKKISSGRVNENFVRINIKKKKFCRGKRNFSFTKYKRKLWMKRQKNKSNVEDFDDTKNAFTEEKLNQDENDELQSQFLTLEEAADLAHGIKPKTNSSLSVMSIQNNRKDIDTKGKMISDDDDFVGVGCETLHSSVQPLFQTNEDGQPIATPKSVYEILYKFGYESFRSGQEDAIMRILSGLSTLLILSTGAGKSLCYQLPAYLYAQRSNCITLVISPLVSLMEDQVTGLPSCLRAVCLHTNLTQVQRQKVLDTVSNGKAHILLISPELAVGGKGFLNLIDNFPPVAFACIDEAHCVSEWSHNFRPSYLRLNKVLREKYGVKFILALTATATHQTANSIAQNLQIEDSPLGIIRGNPLPDNLFLSAAKDEDRDEALIHLLKSGRFSNCNSIIIYCTRREQTEKIAVRLRTCLPQNFKNEKSKSKKNVSFTAEAYHAGLSAAKRKSVQNSFMSGRLKIVVATVAFGMGLDKADVEGVIHYNMPRRFESYVQEIGRAGRDGRSAYCHLFLDSEGTDLRELRRHIYANSVDRSTLRKLIRAVFPTCKCKKLVDTNSSENEVDICPKHEVAVPMDTLVAHLDLKEENIATLLCYLELTTEKWIEILNPVYATCKIRCYSGCKQLKAVARKCPPLAVAIALEMQKGKKFDDRNEIEFAVVAIASQMGWDSGVVKRELKNLEWNFSEATKRSVKSGVMVEFSDLSFHFRAPGNLSDTQLDAVLDYLHSRVDDRQRSELLQLKYAFNVFQSVSNDNSLTCDDDAMDKEKSEILKDHLKKYFTANVDFEEDSLMLPALSNRQKEEYVRADVRQLISIYHDETFNGRAVARIFCGIGSPNFQAEKWGRVKRFWRSHLDVDFDLLCKWAAQEIIGF